MLKGTSIVLSLYFRQEWYSMTNAKYIQLRCIKIMPMQKWNC